MRSRSRPCSTKAAAFFATENSSPSGRSRVIDAEKATYEVTADGRAVGVSRSRYYAWVAGGQAPVGPRAARRAHLTVKIRVAHDASDGVNGAPRILADLREAGEVVSPKTVAQLLMRANEIRGISPRPWRPVTTIAPRGRTRSRTWSSAVSTSGASPWCGSDITYLATGEGWLYLAAVRDGLSRRVIGYAFTDKPAHRRGRDRVAPRSHLPRPRPGRRPG